MKVVVSQRFLPHYRVHFFENVVGRLRADGHETLLYYSFRMGKVGDYPWAIPLFAFKKVMQLGEITEVAGFAPSLLFRLIASRPTVVVLEDLAGLPNSLAASIYCRLVGRPYLIWGLGNIPRKTPSRLRALLKPAIDFLYSGASGFICYNKRAARIYGETGKPTYVAPNACMPRPTDDAHRDVIGRIEKKYLSSKLRIVSVGELKAQKRMDVLLRAVAQLRDLTIELEIVGDGPEKPRLVALTEELKLGNSVRFHGAIYDAATKSKLFHEASLCVLPGRGGLVIQELMSYGVPVICGTADGTEADFIVSGENGMLLDHATDPGQLATAIRSFAARPPEKKQEMAFNAHRTIMDGWHIDGMSEAFCKAVLSVAAQAQPV